MDSEYERRHFVSYEYLNAWQVEKGILSVYKKDDGKLYKNCKAEEFAAENEVRYMSHDELLKVFSCLSGYEVSVKSQGQLHKLNGIHEYAANYCDFQKWMIAEGGGTYLRKQKFKDAIEKSIAEVMDGHRIKQEEKLESIRKNIMESLSGRRKLSETDIKKIKDYISFQISRSPVESSRLKSLLNLPDSGDGCKTISDNMNPLHMVFVKPVGRSFYASDNPVMVMADKRFLKGEYNGIYMPLAPKCMAVLYKGNSATYSITSFESNVVRRFNAKIKENSSMYFFG